MGTDARWQMLLKQNFHRQVSGRHPLRKGRGTPSQPGSAVVRLDFRHLGIHESCHGLDHGKHSFCETAATAGRTAGTRRRRNRLRPRPDNGTASNHYGESRSGPCPREEASRRRRGAPVGSRPYARARSSGTQGLAARDRRRASWRGLKNAPANRHTHSSYCFRARERPRALPSSGISPPVELVTFR
jgi:hypothetical protein